MKIYFSNHHKKNYKDILKKENNIKMTTQPRKLLISFKDNYFEKKG